MNQSKTIQKQMLGLIYDKGRGWAFSRNDFSHFGDSGHIDRTLSRMTKKGVIRRVIRGLYDYPAYSRLLNKSLSPDIDQVAHALARKFGWKIQISGNAALNLVGLSTQVPTQYQYLSDGPSKTYLLGKTEVKFKKTRFTQLGLKYTHNEILVQAVKALGDRALTQNEQNKLRAYLLIASRIKTEGEILVKNSVNNTIESQTLPQMLIDRTLKDTQYVTSWIYRNIRQVVLDSNKSSESIENGTENIENNSL